MKKWHQKSVAVLTAATCLFAGGTIGLSQSSLPQLHLTAVACQAKRKKVTRKIQKTALIYPIYGNQSGFSYVI